MAGKLRTLRSNPNPFNRSLFSEPPLRSLWLTNSQQNSPQKTQRTQRWLREEVEKIKMIRVICALIFVTLMAPPAQSQNRPRAREAGVVVGVLPTGPLNAITDVDGVLVGHTTIIRGDTIRTGVTAIL